MILLFNISLVSLYVIEMEAASAVNWPLGPLIELHIASGWLLIDSTKWKKNGQYSKWTRIHLTGAAMTVLLNLKL